MNKKRTEITECSICKNSRPIPGDAHISCTKPDPDMIGDAYGIRSGWFLYPVNFDPIWKEKDCNNFEEK